MSKRRSSDNEDAPMSRLFVVCNKNISENIIRESFSKFGNIDEIKLLKERDGQSKGVAYVKFSKTSDAAAACESLHGSQIGDSTRPIKVMIAASRQAGQGSSKNERRDEEKALRLFIITPKDFSEDDLYQEFSKYGQVDDVTILKDRKTRDGKQFAYIRFTKFSSAALAFENCDEKFKAVFAEPKPPRSSSQDERGGASLWNEERPVQPIQHISNIPGINLSLNAVGDYGGVGGNVNENECVLHVICSPLLTHDQLWRLCDIVPNLDFCKMNNDGDGSQSATVVYKTPQAASHARQKLHGFEYPPGERLIVKFSSEMKNLSLFESQMPSSSSNSTSFCSVNLPPIQPLSKETNVAQRCFIVLSPNTLPTNLLKQVFCRFGNLIDVFLLSNRNCGYVKYSSVESAKQAITTLHGAEIYGVRLKVMEAEEPNEIRKRSKRSTSPNLVAHSFCLLTSLFIFILSVLHI